VFQLCAAYHVRKVLRNVSGLTCWLLRVELYLLGTRFGTTCRVSELPLHARITSTKKSRLTPLPAELGSITMVLRCNCGVNLCQATAVSAFVLVRLGPGELLRCCQVMKPDVTVVVLLSNSRAAAYFRRMRPCRFVAADHKGLRSLVRLNGLLNLPDTQSRSDYDCLHYNPCPGLCNH
jgi:hypothetical protein